MTARPSVLMPRPFFRQCVACDHQWFTAYFGKMECPKCEMPQPDISREAPHQCREGHVVMFGGECPRCATVNGEPVGERRAPRT